MMDATGASEEVPAVGFDEDRIQARLSLVRKYVARPIPKQPWDDAMPALVPFLDDNDDGDSGEGGIIIAGARHAANIPLLRSMNVTAVLNCASGGIARLPVDELRECGIRYAFTNCRQDSYTYPILHEKKKVTKRPENLERMMNGMMESEEIVCSQHLEVSNSLFADVRRQNRARKPSEPAGNVLFFCVAGQNRSAALAAATLMLHGKPLEDILKHCERQRSFVLENVGFQRQLVELETILDKLQNKGASRVLRDQFSSHWELIEQAQSSVQQLSKRVRMADTDDDQRLVEITGRPMVTLAHSESESEVLAGDKVEIELLIPGLCTMEVRIPRICTIRTIKKFLVRHVNDNLLRHERHEHPSKVAKAWIVLAMFGYDDMYDIPLEVEAVELKVQLERMKEMFGLTAKLINGEPHVTWNERCRFALVIFSVVRLPKASTEERDSSVSEDDDSDPSKSLHQVPWTFVHEERPNAPATLLENTLRATRLRAWDFVSGKSLASTLPIVFSFADDPRDKRAFMMVSRSANTLQQFHAPGEGDILGMGENAIVHRVQLNHTKADGGHRFDEHWQSVASVDGDDDPQHGTSRKQNEDKINSSYEDEEEWDAAVKRPFSLGKMLVFLQNSSEVLYFYGLGLGLSTNAHNENEYKFELMLLARYCQTFSTYTMRCFMEEYMTVLSSVNDEARRLSLSRMHSEFTITSLKVLLVSLLNGFRDLTLMGVQAFDFNHLNNVLVSRDYQSVQLIDIDGNAQGSIDYPSLNDTFADSPTKSSPQKPCLDVDLSILLPSVIEQLILGKGRGRGFVSNARSEIWRAEEDKAKAIIRCILIENFFPVVKNQSGNDELNNKVLTHVTKVAEWFYAVMKKKSPWTNWTSDIYDAMRCIDHLPIS